MKTLSLDYGINPITLANGELKWEAYFEETTVRGRRYVSCGIFDNKWEAEQYFYNITNAR